MNEVILPELNDRAAGDLVNSLAIRSISIVQLSAELNRSPNVREELRYDISKVDVTWSRKDTCIVATFPMEILASAGADESSSVRLGRIRVVFRIEYAFKGPTSNIQNEQLRQFIGIVGFLHVWPYFRAEVQALTAKLDLPALTLPVKLSGHAKHHVVIGQPVSARELAERQKKLPRPVRKKN